jgi:hypothetical protein
VPRPTIQQFEDLIRKDESIFAAYETLDVCDWGLFWQNGLVIDEQILLHYERTAILVRVSLHKDSDAVWRIQGFYFDAAADTAPFGLCK